MTWLQSPEAFRTREDLAHEIVSEDFDCCHLGTACGWLVEAPQVRSALLVASPETA